MKVLIVKLTSMGDLIHVLPAISDAAKQIPNIRFDWVADESFADIPHLHKAVDEIIITANRRWKRNLWQTLKSGELIDVWHNLRKKKYDVVIDAQSNIKSAVITYLARGLRCGVDKNGTREKFAYLAYDKAYPIIAEQHAITRLRKLFAASLGYSLPDTAPDFAIDLEKLPQLPVTLPDNYLVFVHSTTWNSKHWPESYWQQLIQIATQAGYHIALPWGSVKEKERAERLASHTDKATVLPRLSIPEFAQLISKAKGAVCVDTGFGHVTAALNIPAAHLYGPTDPALIGATGQNQLHLIAEYECAPCYLHDCKWGKESACFLKNMRPEKVWEHFSPIIRK
ncbi:MAG: lipopolysaccharide heptosyltransferase I [Legionellales bacterium]|jgi:heptosyltransferase-1